ncbi:MAG: RNA polymerase subunit sigma-24 [candidate division Zixibacteria bacterium]|nr:RNA polymerase subunit sigma-24 [candidate division Zixibacteria bacterium]
MGSKNRYEGINTYAAKIIRYKARRLVGQFGFSEADWEDIEQELTLDLFRRLPKYNPKRAKLNTFIARIVEHKIATIIEARMAAMRDYRLCSCSLNDPLEDEDGHSIERIETIDQDEYLLRIGKLSRPTADLQDLRIDLFNAMERLQPDLRDICEQLLANTITETSKVTGVPRGTIYGHMKKIAAIFEDAGLREYL